MDADIFEEIRRLRRDGRKAVLATIVQIRGSVPSFQTAKMLIRDDGSIVGSVGGGCVEADVWAAAQDVLRILGVRKAQERANAEAFLNWRRFSQEAPQFPIGGIVNGGCTTSLSPEVIAAYDAPFPDDSYKAGARIFPSLVPTGLDDPARADQIKAWEVLKRFDRPWLCAFSDRDPVTAGGAKVFLREVPGTEGQPHVTIEGGGHFLQEDRGPELAQVMVDFIARG